MPEVTSDNLRTLVAEVAAAYFANSHVGVADIGAVIEQITKSLAAVGGAAAVTLEPQPSETAVARRLTAAQIRKSITPDALTSFEDGRPYKTLKRHLSVRGMTGEQYREKWGMPSDYPMVAPNYSAARSAVAKSHGFGAKRISATTAAPPAPSRRRGRPPKTAN